MYDPDPNVDYGYGKDSSGSSSSSAFWAGFGDLLVAISNIDYPSNSTASYGSTYPTGVNYPNQRRSGLDGFVMQSPGGAIYGKVYDEQGQERKIIGGKMPGGGSWAKVK